MRVISGTCKGRVLYSPQTNDIRPTSDRVKQFIFDYIGDTIRDATVLDIFSGTGNLSIEALSRGARSAVLVDNSKEAIRLIYRNLELTGLISQCQIIKQDVVRFLKKRAVEQENKFNFIFADPPYFDNYQTIFEYIGSDNFLANGGFFILEHSSRKELDINNTSLQIEKKKVLGDTTVLFYRKKGS